MGRNKIPVMGETRYALFAVSHALSAVSRGLHRVLEGIRACGGENGGRKDSRSVALKEWRNYTCREWPVMEIV